MLKGGILYYALLVLLLSSLVAGSILLLHNYQNIKITETAEYDNLALRVNSGILLAAYTEDLSKKSSYANYRVFDDDTSTIRLSIKPWGALTVVSAYGSRKNNIYTKSALVGTDPFQDEKTGIYLANNGRGLSISGSSVIKGTCYLPDKRIKAASIEGQPFSGRQLVDGQIMNSKRELPGIRSGFFRHASSISGLIEKEDFSVIKWSPSLPADLNNSFTEKTILIYGQAEIELSDCSLTGNIIVFSGASVKIDSSCLCEDIIVIAPDIVIGDGFKGNLQAFSDISIRTGERCKLLLPSVLAVGNSVTGYAGKKSIIIGYGSDIHGTIVINRNITEPEIVIKEKARIFGQLYCPGQVILKSDILGSVYCKSFYLQTKRAKYLNHLLNNSVNPLILPEHYAGAGIFEEQNAIRITKWLD